MLLFASLELEESDDDDDDDDMNIDIADEEDGHDDDETELPSSPVQSNKAGGDGEETLTTLSVDRGWLFTPVADVVATSEALCEPVGISFEPTSIVRAAVPTGGGGKTGMFPT